MSAMSSARKNVSRLAKWTAAAATLAIIVTAAFYSPNDRTKRAAKIAPDAQISTAKAEPSAPPAPSSLVKRASISQIPVASAKNPPHAIAPQQKVSDKNDFRMAPDTGSGEEGGETGDDPKQRADYFYRQRAYPFAQTPAGVRQQSLQQLDAMVKQQRAMGILPEADAAPSLSVGFPGPSNWTNLGPQPVTNSAGGANFGNPSATGRVTAIAVDPTTTNTSSQVIYIGAATGGVWKSTNGGTSWTTIFDQNNSLAIGGIAIAPGAGNNNIIYVGTGELNFSGDSYYGAGVYKSTDGGNTWTQQCGGASVNFCAPTFPGAFQGGGFYVGTIAVNPTNPLIALASVRNAGNSTVSGIYRTTDGGANWNLLVSASGAAGNSIIWNPSDSTVVYATLGERGNATKFGVYKSTDSGVTFTQLTGNGATGNNLPTTNLGRHEMAVAPSNGNVIYVAINDEPTSGLLGLAKSTDGGTTWSFTTPGTLPNLPNFCSGQCWYDMALAVLPTDPNTLIVGGSAFTNNSSTDFRSSDGGVTWTDITNGSSAVRPHVDTHALTFAATTGGFRLYTGNDGGVWFTDNPTASTVTWEAGNNTNLTITQFYPGHSVHPSDENISYGGTQDNGTEKYSGIPAWDHVACGDGAWTAIDPNIPTTVYTNCQNISILRSALDGTAPSWVSITNELGTSGDRSLFISPLVQDPIQSGLLYFGTFRVWQSTNYGNDWTPISPDLTTSNTNEVTSVTVAPPNNSVVYATTTDGQVWRTTNANAGSAATWTNLTAAPLPNRYATMVRTDHASADIAYLSYSGFSGFNGDTVGHIFKTTNGGSTWSDISGTGAGALPNSPVNDIAVVHYGAPINFDAVFIATDVGVFECPDPTSATPCTTWSPVGSGLPKVPVVGLAFRQASATIRAITHGRGVWVIETPGLNTTGLLLLTSITPSSATSASGAFTMTFEGNDFGVPSGTPQILVDGININATNITVTSPTQMTATIPASVTAAPGLHQISIDQPGHAPTPSNPTSGITFSVTGPAPTLTSISPNHILSGSASFPLTATGTNFFCTAGPSETLIQFAGILLTPTSCTATSITVTVPANLVANAGSATVFAFSPGPGGGLSAAQTFTIPSGTPDMTISKSHTGNFVQGQIGAAYTITASNIGGGATTAAVSVVDTLPTGLTATAITGTGWTCTLATLTCTTSNVLSIGASYPPIALTVNVAANAPASVTNTATVSGGGETITTNDVATDVTTILTPPTATLSTHALAFTNQGVNTTSVAQSITVTNNGGATLTFTSAPTITAANAANFAVASGTTCTNGATVPGGGTCIINITFTPPSVGSFGPATLTLTDNASPSTQTATLTGTGIDFTLTATTSTSTITAGQTATFTISAAPATGGFPNAITFSASGVPSASSASFTPPSVTPGSAAATTTLSISTTARGVLPPSNPRAPRIPPQFALWSFALATILLGLIFFGRNNRQRRFAPAVFITLTLLLAIGISGCGSNSTPPPPTGTPAGTSTITVTAQSGSLIHTTTVTLTVQ
jgi:uncharacterized repeat protein (TIGR01451 family)